MYGLIFDCDGVLIDLEQTWHRESFNQAWREFGVPWQWTAEEYTAALAVSGGRERLDRLYRSPAFRRAVTVPEDRDTWLRMVEAWHARKTEILVARVTTAPSLPVRPGVRRLAAEAVAGGWGLAVASSGARATVEAVVCRALGADLAGRCAVLAADSVRRRKPAPDVYLRAAATLGLPPERCVAIEDTRDGLFAAKAAGMTCVVTPVAHTAGADFGAADLVVPSLGEPPRGWVSLADLRRVVERALISS